MKRYLLFSFSVFAVCLLAFTEFAWAKKCYVDNAAGGSTHNGTSWAAAWTSIGAITGVTGGDTVFISGGTTSKTYTDMMYTTQGGTMWLPVSGTTNKPIIYKVGQDAGHNGTVIFNGGGAVHWIFGGNWITIDGNVGGARHIEVTNFGDAVCADGSVGFVLRYATVTGKLRFLDVDKVELDHIYCNPQDGIDGAIWISGTGGDYNSNLIHDCTVNVYYQHGVNAQGGNGDDGIQGGYYCTIANNIFRGVLTANFVGNQHQDGIQTLTPVYTRVIGNYYENMANYCLYFEYFSGGANAQVYNNVFNYADPVLTAQPSCGIAIGGSSGSTGGTISNLVVANNTVIGGARGISLEGGNQNTVYANAFVVNNLVYGSSLSIEQHSWGGITYMNNQTAGSAGVFVNAAGNDFHLKSGSTGLIDAGTSWPSTYFTTDKDGISRPQGSAWDIGAYEYTTTGLRPSTSSGADRGMGSELAAQSLLPNPITVALLGQYAQSNKNILIYDPAGKLVKTGSLYWSGIYLLAERGNKNIQKAVVVK